MRKNSFMRLVGLAAAVLLAAVWSVSAQAQLQPRAVSGGSGQFYIGNGLPIPHPSFGGAKWTPYAFILTSNNGQTVVQPPHRLTHNGPGQNQPVLFANAFVFQVYTNLSLRVPRASNYATFVAGGRTGADNYVWCPGQTGFGGGGNPVCSLTPSALSVTVPNCDGDGSCPGSGTVMLNVGNDLGWARYSRTANQVGGPSRGNTGGTVNVALNVDNVASPGQAEVAILGGPPAPTGAIGGAFGSYNQGFASAMPGFSVTTFTSDGALTGNITNTGLTGQCPFLGLPGSICVNNTTASFGVPFTGGMLTLSAPAAGEMFMLTGSDARNAAGSGNVTLVGGAVSQRSFSGPNANRGMVTLTVPEPTAVAGLVGALLALVGAHRLVRRRSR